MESNTILIPLWLKITGPIVAFIVTCGVFFYKRKERFDVDMTRTKFSNELEEKRQGKFDDFHSSLLELGALPSNSSSIDLSKSFWGCARSANNYFNTLEKIAENINSSAVDVKSWETSNYLKIKEAVEDAFPIYYKVMIDLAQNNEIKFSDTLKKEKYPSIVSLLKGRLSPEEFEKHFTTWA